MSLYVNVVSNRDVRSTSNRIVSDCVIVVHPDAAPLMCRTLFDEVSPAKERLLNQFGTAVLFWCGKHRWQGMPHYATLERQLIQSPLLSCAKPNG